MISGDVQPALLRLVQDGARHQLCASRKRRQGSVSEQHAQTSPRNQAKQACSTRPGRAIQKAPQCRGCRRCWCGAGGVPHRTILGTSTARQQRVYDFMNDTTFSDFIGELSEDAEALFKPTATARQRKWTRFRQAQAPPRHSQERAVVVDGPNPTLAETQRGPTNRNSNKEK